MLNQYRSASGCSTRGNRRPESLGLVDSAVVGRKRRPLDRSARLFDQAPELETPARPIAVVVEAAPAARAVEQLVRLAQKGLERGTVVPAVQRSRQHRA